MPEIIVNINDQDYAIVCDPGEEDHLKSLSSRIDFKVRQLTKRFGKKYNFYSGIWSGVNYNKKNC